MPYRSLLQGNAYAIAAFRNGDQQVVTVPFAENDGPSVVYSVLVALAPTPVGMHELSFCIVEFNVDLDHEHRYWSGLETKTKVSDPKEREICVQIIVNAVRTMLTENPPSRVFLQTCDANMPLTARRKYERIIEVFVERGYVIHHQEPYHGRDSWVMERTDG